MLNINLESRGKERNSLTFVGSIFVLLTLFFFSLFSSYTGNVPECLSLYQSYGWANLFDWLDTLEILGQILYTKCFILFLMAGFILLIALIGSIVLTLQTRQDVRKQSVGQQRSRNVQSSVFLVSLDQKPSYL